MVEALFEIFGRVGGSAAFVAHFDSVNFAAVKDSNMVYVVVRDQLVHLVARDTGGCKYSFILCWTKWYQLNYIIIIIIIIN